MVDLKKLLAPRKRRKKPRSDGPKTIVPPRDDPFDAARERLKAQIPPAQDD